MTEKGYFKIALEDDSVPKEKYQEMYERAIAAETKLQNILKMCV